MKHVKAHESSIAQFSIRATVECSCGTRFVGDGWTRGPALTAAIDKLNAHIAEFTVDEAAHEQA